MPTLPERPEVPGPAERVSDAFRRVGAAVGADARVTFRAIVFLAVAAIVVSLAPTPWSAIGTIALIGLAIDWARTKGRHTP